MKRINQILDYLLVKTNVVQAHEVQPLTLDDNDFLLLFTLTEISDVVDLESRLLDDSSEFKEKFVSFFCIFSYIVFIQNITQNIS